jgi:hypothetical protein
MTALDLSDGWQTVLVPQGPNEGIWTFQTAGKH